MIMMMMMQQYKAVSLMKISAVCFLTYEEDQLEETGLLWVQCVCRRWIHEDCYEDVLTDKNGRELIYPYCVM